MSYVNGSCQLCANRNLFEFSIETLAEHPHLIYGVIHTNRVSIFLILSVWQNWNSKLFCNLFKCKNFSWGKCEVLPRGESPWRACAAAWINPRR